MAKRRGTRGSDPELERTWRDRIGACEVSGLTARAFCREHGLSEPSFYAWRRKLRAREAAGRSQDGKENGAFVPVTVVSDSRRDEAGIEVELPAGVIVRISGAPSSETIAAVLGVFGIAS